MSGTRAPLWLAQPTRFAAFGRGRARGAMLLLALFVALGFSALASPGPPPASHDPARRAQDRADVALYEAIVAGVRSGGDYYVVAADTLRRDDYPLRPFVTFRLPTLAVVQAKLPPRVTLALLYVLAAAVLAAWFRLIARAIPRPAPRALAMVLLVAGMATFVQPELVPFHEVWAGLLIALSLALRRDDRWRDAVALGLIAMLIRETAALYVMLMAALALIQARRREAAAWATTLGVLALVLLAHAWAVDRVVNADDPASPGWAGMLGWGFFVKTMSISTALTVAPLALAAPLVALALFGWASWRDAAATRALATFLAYAALLALFGRTDTFYWGLMIAPSFLVGLVFVPDALRDLVHAGFMRRRIIVTRAVR